MAETLDGLLLEELPELLPQPASASDKINKNAETKPNKRCFFMV
ncbi:hypothetical protein BCO26_2928 [Heyndrickxia coagulans 2-6]|nr:hypothetical protein BCO26_2928 [Heyndrickxia coagulans 2-6]